MHTAIDSSPELLLRPHLNGVEFVRPQINDSSYLSLHDVMQSSIATYIMTTDSKVSDANEATLHLNHVHSFKSLLGRNATEIWKGEGARMMMRHDNDVMTNKNLLISDDTAENYTGVIQAMLSFKLPIYRNDSVAGVLGFTLQIDADNVARLASKMTTLTKTGLIKPEKINQIQDCLNASENKVYFSKREMEVLALVVKGFTAKKISIMLGLSTRTVEHHIDNLKLKSGCARKYELIYKFANGVKA